MAKRKSVEEIAKGQRGRRDTAYLIRNKARDRVAQEQTQRQNESDVPEEKRVFVPPNPRGKKIHPWRLGSYKNGNVGYKAGN